MSPNNTHPIEKSELNGYLNELAKEYKKCGGRKMPVEIIMVGGAAILGRYTFRAMSADIDACAQLPEALLEAARRVGERHGLAEDWFNNDFMRTGSYTPALYLHATYYKTFAQVLTVRVIEAEYLIAMKLRAGRKYKHDLSDVIGILAEHEQRGDALTLAQIDKAVCELYGGWDGFPEESHAFIQNAFTHGNFEQTYRAIQSEEQTAKELLIGFEQQYPNVATQDNVADILQALKSKQSEGGEAP